MEKAILRTLAYADVFDYPLTSGELYRFLIADKSDSYSDFRRALTRIKTNDKRINTNGEYFFLQGRKGNVAVRKQRERWSASKMKFAGKIAGILRLIPWVKLIGVTGALAMNNADKEDDIDLLVMTSKNRLWLSRGLAVFLLELMGKRRRPREKKVKDKICLNMLLDESHLAIPEKERDLFSAHEVCQMKLVWERGQVYHQFLKDNSWVEKYLPNSSDIKKLRDEDIKGNKKRTLNFSISQFLNFFENLAYKFQLVYMKSRQTTEVVEPHRIRFHPQDAREWVLKEYQARLKKLQIG